MSEKVPRRLAHVILGQLKLDAKDGFLLTRIDGRAGRRELARDTGLPDFQVDSSLEKLERLGVIEFVSPGAAPRETAKPQTLTSPPPSARDRTQLPQFGSLGVDARYDPKELEEEVDLSAEQKKRVLDIFYRLDDLDHFTLLGIARDADKKSVKRAYFELASVMHPDRYFKKNLGSFKPKVEALFDRITEAHDTLVDASKRLAYGAYLDEVATTMGMEALLARAVEEAQSFVPVSSSRPPGAAASEAMPPPHRSPSNAGPSARLVSTGPDAHELQARREALGKRLLGGKSARATTGNLSPPSQAPSPLRYSNSGEAVEALRRRYEERIENVASSQLQRYIKAGEEALAKNDIVAAASAFQIATKFAPNDAGLAMRYQEVKNDADTRLWESYTKQATYEEENRHWPEAARSWQKVCKLRVGDANANAHAARCILRAADPNLHHAAEHAKCAVACEPAEVDHHATLAEVYLKAGLFVSAKKAAETGLHLAPNHAVLLGILKKATKT